jgi:hypothetical protein
MFLVSVPLQEVIDGFTNGSAVADLQQHVIVDN